MKTIFSKILLNILLVISAGLFADAQTTSFKNLNGEIQTIQKQLVPDKRVAILDISLSDPLQPVLIVKGETNLPEGKIAIIKLLKTNGFQFVDSIKVLPDASLGDKTWGLVTLSASSMRSKPDHAAEMLSQALMGTPLKVLDHKGGWYRVQTPDYYIGWMEGSAFKRLTSAELNGWKKSNRYIYKRIMGNVFASPSRKSEIVSDLVMGDLLEVESVTKGFLKVRFPDGRSGFVKKSDCLSWQKWTSQKPDVQAVISVAKQLMGVPYLWGGTSCKAVDCSGMTKTAYFSQGIILARDASQQARYGEHPDFNDIPNLAPGDLLFFGRSAQRITHVGLYLGNDKYINAAAGLVRINNINPKSPDFSASDRKDLVAAGRIMNSLNTEGIVLVKNHPWY
ncbi:MAG: NlpC/P60 family protein [Bacteroidota bacterium]|nr:NlpC/P60 family protein [Bacteroidota bacterium]